MNMPRRLPISTQDFEKLRNAGDLYVDKTQYIEKLLSLGTVFFLSRPHRFGKSLFLSTLKAYFEGRKELFEGLYIAEREEKIARWQKGAPWEASPVLYFALNATNYNSPESLPSLLEQELKKWEALYEVKGEALAPERRFANLIEELYRKEGKQVVILVDEYDKPLLETVEDEALNEANRSLLKAFYEVIKQCDRYIRFAFLTGITKFSKTTLFSGVNNLIDITLLDDYDAICGFTEEELTAYLSPQIAKLAEAESTTVEETRARLKKEYDGYCFAEKGVRVYNPYSLLKVLATSKYKYYWFENATPSYLVRYLRRMEVFMPDLEDELLLDSESLQDFRYNDADSVIPLLFQSGYLTIRKYLADEQIYQLGYPNEEVRFGFLQELLPLYVNIRRDEVRATVLKLYRALRSGDMAEAMAQISTILAGIIYGNTPSSEKGRPLREQYYQSVLYAVFRLLGIHAQAEVVCATGRIDMLVMTREHVYIFEFKVNTQGTAQDAIDQIKDREYFRMVSAEGRCGGAQPVVEEGRGRTVHLVGVSFDEKTRNIGEWKEEVR
ncbi:MAG: AAA family ATPase [Bacteroides sp.]